MKNLFFILIVAMVYGCSAQKEMKSEKVFNPDTIPCKAQPHKPLQPIEPVCIPEKNML